MLQKVIFKEEVRKILLAHILTGHIKPGQRISLPGIARELQLSVTPIREALTQLSETGIVVYIPNRGFFLTELSAREAKEVYQLMAVMEGYAVRHSEFNSKQIEELKRINRSFIKAKSALKMLDYDRRFHQKLIETFPNQAAHKILENLRVKISLYDYAFWNEEQKMTSITMHEKIIKLLEAQQIDEAVQYIEENWIQGIDYIVTKFEQHQSI